MSEKINLGMVKPSPYFFIYVMIIHRKIKSWLDKFKPGVKFRYNGSYTDNIYTVDEDKPFKSINWLTNKPSIAFCIHTDHNLGKGNGQLIWGGDSQRGWTRIEDNIEFIENDNA